MAACHCTKSFSAICPYVCVYIYIFQAFVCVKFFPNLVIELKLMFVSFCLYVKFMEVGRCVLNCSGRCLFFFCLQLPVIFEWQFLKTIVCIENLATRQD